MYRIGICDDDKALCSVLEEDILAITKDLKIESETEVWYSGEEIEKDLQNGQGLDLLFLDIELAKKDGVEVGQFIRKEMKDIRTHIVYISSKESYAMQLFKIQPLDFLVKPLEREQLIEVLTRSIRQSRKKETYFEYRKGRSYYKIPMDDICYFESVDKKIRIVGRNGQEEFYGKMREVEKYLPANFLMIHQSFIINHDYVSEYSYETVKMMNGVELNISKPYRKEIRAKIIKYQRE